MCLFCVQPQAGASELQQGGSIFPAVQNFLLAARAQGLGAAITLWHDQCAPELRALVGIPDDWHIATLVTVGWPRGSHQPVRRKALCEVAVVDQWDRQWKVTLELACSEIRATWEVESRRNSTSAHRETWPRAPNAGDAGAPAGTQSDTGTVWEHRRALHELLGEGMEHGPVGNPELLCTDRTFADGPQYDWRAMLDMARAMDVAGVDRVGGVRPHCVR